MACQRGGVSDEPPWLRTATRNGSRDPFGPLTGGWKPLKIKKDGPFLLRQGEPGTSQYRHTIHEVFCSLLYSIWLGEIYQFRDGPQLSSFTSAVWQSLSQLSDDDNCGWPLNILYFDRVHPELSQCIFGIFVGKCRIYIIHYG